ncbi:non-ribosomal peptide synthetase, partial [Dictyobacter arantiisoli]|uniref:non-ribosomal peptide synthetase n=1 Tax=Dictyobacter arantiisoli TaxID=2014874 RepID=UPI0011EE6458
SDADHGAVPIGRPIANTQLYVLDAWFQPVPIGVPGELYIGGSALARGYTHPDLTAERFLPHPFSTEPGARLYRTGDRVWYRADGTLQYLGRIDQQVKLRGFRIELGEIEAALLAYPAIREAVVVVRDDPPIGKQLVAYLVGHPEQSLIIDKIHAFLQGRLPSYMHPGAWVCLDVLPLTLNGKVDRHALPAPAEQPEAEGQTREGAQTPLEELVLGTWSAVLGRQQVGRHDNFFALGGHSLLATQLMTRLRAMFNIELPLRTVFETPTVAGLAHTIKQRLTQEHTLSVPPLLAGTRPLQLPLSFAQQRLWFLDQLEPGSAAYLVPSALRMQGTIDIWRLEESLHALIQRHESLRTTFAEHDGQPLQVIHATRPVRLPLIDLQGLDPERREREAHYLAEQEAQRSCDLTQGPLLRTSILRLEREEHILLLTLHHIITDGWSNGILVRELTDLYRSFVAEQPSSLSPLPFHYADYALWQRQWLQGEVLEAQMAYWRTQLSAATLLDLPTDHPRPAIQSYRGASLTWQLPISLSENLQMLSRQQDVTLFMLLLASFQVLLMRYSGQSDISVGTPIANRQHEEIEGVMGFFVNTLVLRTDLSGSPTFQQVLQRVREVCLGAYAHQDLPFELLVESLEQVRDLSRSSLFQVMFVLQNAPGGQSEVAGIHMHPLEVQQTQSKFDLTLFVEETERGFSGTVEYSTELFEPETIQRLLGHWQVLLAAIVENPTQGIEDMPLLTQNEREQLLIQWNQTVALPVLPLTLHESFEQQVERTPETIALVYEEQHLTYRELNARANQLAHYLHLHGVSLDQPVGLFMPRSLELLIGLLGVLKAGGAYVPFDASYPLQRLTFMLQDANPALLLTQQAFLPHARALIEPLSASVPLLCLDQPPEELKQQSIDNLHVGCLPENLAYVMYTSGSTGQPKGVALPHEALRNLFDWHEQDCPLQPDTVVLQFAPISFDASCEELFTTWQRGGKIVELSSDEMRRDPETLLALMEREQIERWYVPYAGLQNMALWATQQSQPSRVQLQTIITAGEQLQVTPAIVNWLQHMPGCTLHNYYGPTESHVVTAHELHGEPAHWPLFPPIGRPISNTQIYILDRNLQSVPIRVAGELYIGGINLARGYIHKPDLTAERFVPHVWSQEPGTRLYRTGDLARYRPDGSIEFLGRVDQQIKLRGYRIEPGEIETVLQTHPAVQETVVVLREDTAEEKSLVAYVVVRPETYPGQEELRRWLGQQVPDYMVPASLVFLDVLPLTPSGKLDRRALPTPDQQILHDGVVIEPRTPLEELVRAIWADLLHLPPSQISIHDNFFMRGGYSLLATQVISRLRQRVQVAVPLRYLFEDPTVVGLTQRIEQLLRQEEALPMPPLLAGPRPQKLPLSFAQQRLWFLDQFEPGSTTYLAPVALHIEGIIDIQHFEQSLHAIIARHESLRTTFVEQDRQPLQVIHTTGTVRFPVIDLQGLAPQQRKQEARHLAEQEAQRPCDLVQGPLLRTAILRLERAAHVLLLTLHHIITDGWSNDVLVRELTTHYRSLTATGHIASLPPLPLQYVDYALWQRQWLRDEALDAQVAYWQKQLADVLPLDMPTDHPRPLRQSYRGAALAWQLPETMSAGLNDLSRQHDVTLFMLLLASFQVLLMRYSGQSDISVGTPIANRQHTEIEEIIGFFVNTLVLRTDLSGNPTFVQVLQRVREVCLSAYAHQDLPFENVVEAISGERDLSRSPLFQVMFVLQNTPHEQYEVSGVQMSPLEVTHTVSKFDLTLFVNETEQGVAGTLEYSTELFEAETIHRLLGHWKTVLEAVLQHPQTPICALPLLTTDEYALMLNQWNATQHADPQPLCLHQRIEQQVQLTPDAIALVFEEQLLTYAELNRRANQLAHHLQQQGIGPEAVVGVCLERCPDMVIALLAILKTGGTYLPMDPGYPVQRLQYLIHDAALSLVLSHASLQDRLPGLPAATSRLLLLDRAAARWRQEADDNLTTAIPLDQLAYIMYTSGSTGQPKGVMISHRGLSHYVAWSRQHYAQRQAIDSVVHTSVGFDLTVTSLFVPLVTGGKVRLLPEAPGIDA